MRFIYVFLLFLISFCTYAGNSDSADSITATVSGIEWSCLVTNDEIIIGRGCLSGNYSDATVDYALEGKIAIPAQINGKNVVGINDCAFVGCGKITEVAVPASVRWLGKEVFYKCSSLETIVFRGDLPQIDGQVFLGLNARPIVRVSAMTSGWCQYVKSANFMGLPIEYVEKQISVDGLDFCDTGPGLILVCARNRGACFEIPAETSGKTVISVGAYAFVDSGASVVVLPSGVEQVHTQAFSGTSSLTTVLCVGSKPDGFAAAIDAAQLVGLEKVKLGEGCCLANESFVVVYSDASRVVFPSGLLEIPELCCVGLTNLCDVVVPSSVTNIARSAFCSCPCLTNVVFASGLQSIGSDAFRLCERLSTVELPDSVKVIYSGAFAECSSLRAISLPHNLEQLGPPATSTKTMHSYREDGTLVGI